MGFDDLKVVEAAQFIGSFLSGNQLAPSVADGWAAAEVDEAIVCSAKARSWQDVKRIAGVSFA